MIILTKRSAKSTGKSPSASTGLGDTFVRVQLSPQVETPSDAAFTLIISSFQSRHYTSKNP